MAIAVDEFPAKPVTDYTRVRSELQNGDVLICSGTGVFSSMIQQATGSVWSHVAFILRLDEIDRVMLLESVESIGVRTIRLSRYLTNYHNDGEAYPGGLAVIRNRQFAQTVAADKLEKLARYAVDQFGYPYDKDEIARIAARILASRIPFEEHQWQRIAPNHEFICSEYVARCYAQAGLNIQWNRLGFIAPSDFAADPDFDLMTVLKRP